jgi:two-component system nitrogen regulation sensor histidine kinase GlnL
MNPLAVSAFISSITSLCLGGFVFFKKGKDNITISYALLTISFFVWIFGLGMEIVSPNKNWGLFWNRWLYSGAIFIPTFFIHFIQAYLNKIKIKLLISAYTISTILLVFNFTPLFVKDVVPKGSFNYASVPGIVFPFFVFYFFIVIIYSFYLIIQEYKYSLGVRRNQLKFIIIASVIGFSGGSTNYLLVFDILHVPPIGNYFITLYLFILSYAIIKHRLMDINIVLKKGTTYTLLLLLLFIPSFILILLGQKIFYGKINYLFTVMMFSILFLAAILFHRIKPRTEKAVDHFLFKDRYNYRETLGKFSKAMVNILDLQSLLKRIIETITQTMGVDKASLFLLDDEKGGYNLFESKNIKMHAPTPLLPKGAPLPVYLQKMGEIVVREELAKGANIPELNGVIQQMSLLEAEASIPLISKRQLIGMINLSYKFNKDVYYHEDIELLTTLANQAAIAIENARLFEDLKKSKSYIRRADRLASLGTLTAGLAHEIRNPLVAIKTLIQLLPERLEDEEFRNHFLSIAAGEVDRISHLINELLDFARPSTPKLEFEDVNSILDGMILLVSTESKKKHIHVDKQYAPDLPSVKVDREQIKQVFLNVLLNAIEATPENGEITVKTRSFLKPGGEPYLQVEFKDTGCGIPHEYLEEIFNPFYTTKTTGSGLGLSISNQIVLDHKGYIDVESQVSKGTSFVINLPVDQDRPKRRQTDLETQRTTFFEP